MVKFGYLILTVEDVAKAVAFYEASFGFLKKFISPDNDYAELQTGETAIAFISKELGRSNLKNGFIESSLQNKPFGIELALVTETVDETIQRSVENGAVLVEAPVQKPWGQTVAYIRDINGFLIELCTPMSA
ncbi:VOC family protein [Chitinophaga agri]|uniref:VOC family protein n=1 Tax=Chitinophaga agri TaxID=2703787 RepID=A0A6B9Z789_9BACT|nr:VOC family protein [Chitinophaga agri]QHS58092.1 VOC family protein [Chitinophaga agri]